MPKFVHPFEPVGSVFNNPYKRKMYFATFAKYVNGFEMVLNQFKDLFLHFIVYLIKGNKYRFLHSNIKCKTTQCLH